MNSAHRTATRWRIQKHSVSATIYNDGTLANGADTPSCLPKHTLRACIVTLTIKSKYLIIKRTLVTTGYTLLP